MSDYIIGNILWQCYCYVAWKYTRLQQDFAKDFMRRSFFENFYVTHCFDYLIGAPFPKQILAKRQVYLLWSWPAIEQGKTDAFSAHKDENAFIKSIAKTVNLQWMWPLSKSIMWWFDKISMLSPWQRFKKCLNIDISTGVELSICYHSPEIF